jgi:hypothetical protein
MNLLPTLTLDTLLIVFLVYFELGFPRDDCEFFVPPGVIELSFAPSISSVLLLVLELPELLDSLLSSSFGRHIKSRWLNGLETPLYMGAKCEGLLRSRPELLLP